MKINIKTQPDDVTCGPTSLHAIYAYYHDGISLEETIQQIKQIPTGGTIAPMLGNHALQRGYHVTLYAYNLTVFDPTWFHPKKISSQFLVEKLEAQLHHKKTKRMIETSLAYIEFLKLGGEIEHHDLTIALLKKIFFQQIPILTGLSATYLYQSARERGDQQGESTYDDLRGEPVGHFVVLCGYDKKKRHVIIADPHRMNPISHDNYYKVSSTRLINAIMLGVLTYDANLLLITKKNNP